MRRTCIILIAHILCNGLLAQSPDDRPLVGMKNPDSAIGIAPVEGTSFRHAGHRSVFEWLSPRQIEDVKSRTELFDLTLPIQQAIHAVGNGTLYFPSGTYKHRGLVIQNSVNLEGDGWGFDSNPPYTPGTCLHNVSLSTPSITIDSQLHANHYDHGARLFNMEIKGNGSGSNSQNKSSDVGVWIRGAANVLIDRCNIFKCGSHGIYFAKGTNLPTVQNCYISACSGAGIYARQGTEADQILDLKILNNEITNNRSHGVSIWGTCISIQYNTIQDNLGAGVYLGYDDPGAASAHCYGTWIKHNYFENNKLSNIKGLTQYASGSPAHYVQNCSIEDNYLYMSSATTDIILDCSNPYVGVPTYRGLRIRNNYYNSTGHAWIDFKGHHDGTSILELPQLKGFKFGSQFLGVMNNQATSVTVLQEKERSSEGPEVNSADYLGQVSRDVENGVYSRAVAVGGGASDWKPMQSYQGGRAPIKHVWPKGLVYWNINVSKGGNPYWINMSEGGAYGCTRSNNTSYQRGAWVLWSSGESVWECTASGKTGSEPPAITGKRAGDIVKDGSVVWTCRSLAKAIWVAAPKL